ncbi:TPA: hypothetical protein RZC39_001317 [Salmonella enterica subsp. enterica serovar Liverpool]|nr:hypothetical protein [Salmonella enterica]EBI0290146.1 hypothetical protein [Salmonella enterica subsp. enterica serovar Saintpaul]EBP3622126.1 hypothetical protein [Salmonella enterica subsp. enterica]EEC6780725.1 hypothetical protein [Salmonella enterica subsp. enterica serovar Olten]EHG1540197.1 hypothetical protein [Salmonella enterica subsp. enterica serovar Duisburg]EII0537835.1 hypothetical protein [Salmonella enterica subsp. enterica serovar Kintambo]
MMMQKGHCSRSPFGNITLSEFFLPAAGRLYSEQNIMKMTFPARQQLDAGRMTTTNFAGGDSVKDKNANL